MHYRFLSMYIMSMDLTELNFTFSGMAIVKERGVWVYLWHVGQSLLISSISFLYQVSHGQDVRC